MPAVQNTTLISSPAASVSAAPTGTSAGATNQIQAELTKTGSTETSTLSSFITSVTKRINTDDVKTETGLVSTSEAVTVSSETSPTTVRTSRSGTLETNIYTPPSNNTGISEEFNSGSKYCN